MKNKSISKKQNLLKMKRNNTSGITLIALVITIIVLLILAGVSIAMLTGENGILTQAQKAKTETENAATNEAARLDEYNNTLENWINGGTTGVNKPETDENGLYLNNSTINGEEIGTAMNPTIPAGFKPVNTETSSWGDGSTAPAAEDVNNGLVIEDKSGSQFVWIPVETPVSDIEANGTTNKAMAIKDETTGNYRGLLYNFTSSGSEVTSGCTTTTDSYREPDVVTGSDGNSYDAINYASVGYSSLDSMKNGLQSEYNKMMQSVETYHGFYVGRYELGLEGTTPVAKNASTNEDVTTADSANSNTYMWYGLYSKCKEFAPESSNKSVVSSMIWGSQYDAMMNWMQKNGEKVASGNDSKTNRTEVTGSNANDILKNVYDLYGCHYEWTLEANSANFRVSRGGGYYASDSPKIGFSNGPTSADGYGAARLTLYISSTETVSS